MSKSEDPRIKSHLENQTSGIVFHVPFLSVTNNGVVEVQFLLRIDIFKIFDQVPPFLIGLDVNGIGLLVFNDISSSLCQQG